MPCDPSTTEIRLPRLLPPGRIGSSSSSLSSRPASPASSASSPTSVPYPHPQAPPHHHHPTHRPSPHLTPLARLPPLRPPSRPLVGVRPPVAATPSLENRLGSQVFNRIGIVALLIAATWFLKLAVDNRWIGPTGRILIGLLAGVGLVLWSERFRRKGFAAFSYSLKAVGSGVLYLALWAAFQLYHLLPSAVALGLMLLVTAWNAYMAWAQDAELLAAYALAGGLSTPLLLSTGGNHEIFLFTYILAIDLAAVALARLRSWPRLLPGALAATIAYFIGWYAGFYTSAALSITSLFVVLLAGVFASVPLSYRGTSAHPQEKHADRVLIQDVFLPIASAAFLSLALYSVLQDAHHHDLLPWLMLVLSAVYLGLMRLPQSRLASAIHLSLAVVLLTVAIPLKASGAWIVIAWLVEGTALLWVSTRAFDKQADQSSPGLLTLLLLSCASLFLGFAGCFFELSFAGIFAVIRTPFLNAGFGTALTGLAAFALSLSIAYQASHPPERPRAAWYRHIAAALTVAFNLVAIFATVVQINLLFRGTAGNADSALQRALAVSAFLMLYGALLLAVGFWRRSAFIRWQALVLLVLTIAKTFLYDMRNLSQGYRVLSFLALGVLLMAVSFAYGKDWLALREPGTVSASPALPSEEEPSA